MKQWKKYVGYDKLDQSLAGEQSASPGPVDNVNLFRTDSCACQLEGRPFYLVLFLCARVCRCTNSSTQRTSDGRTGLFSFT